MAMHADRRARAALVEKIYAAPSAAALRQAIRENNVGKILVHPAFEHRLMQNKNGAYKEYLESVAALFPAREDSKNTLVIYESREDIGHARGLFAGYGAILEPQHWIINCDGYLGGEGSGSAAEIMRALVRDSSAFAIGGLALDLCVPHAASDIRKLLEGLGVPGFPCAINRLITKTAVELANSFWKG